jgi:glucan phosphorylase
MESVQDIPQRLSGLGKLAENMWWSWNPAARMLFKALDRQAWKESIHNPDKMLKELPSEIMERAAVDEDYLRHYDVVMSRFEKYMQQKKYSLLADTSPSNTCVIAYFSAEYGDRDNIESAEMYRIIEQEVIPLFYDFSEEGIPRRWVKVMKESIKSSAARFSARRMVKEYLNKFYANTLKEISNRNSRF